MPEQETVLIVDDDPAVRRGLDLRLRAAGYNTLQCHTAASGLAAARDQRPAAVILDGSLPDLEGAEFIRRLLESDNLAPIPVVVVSGAEEKRLSSLDAGAVSFLLKPYDRQALLTTVRDAIDGSRNEPSDTALTVSPF
ncbi:MAG TPA: response regulator [Planctomycetaceae bacterium]|jgi:DNA-binding response OmpR family regulator